MSDFIKEYLERGFGSMNKNDFEVAIFHELLQENDYKNKSNYELSRELRIPESKVSRLRYEAALKYPMKEDDYWQKISEALHSVQLHRNKENIILSFEDKAVRMFLKSELKKKGLICDGSFNSELVLLSNDAYVWLLQQVPGRNDKWKELLKEHGKDLTKDIVGMIAGQAANSVFDMFNIVEVWFNHKKN